MEELTEVQPRIRVRTILGILFFILFLAGMGYFAWRVVYYANAIQRGDLVFSDVSFLKEASYTTSIALRPIPEGTFETATTDDPSMGPVDAPIEIVEFADFGCPFSSRSSSVLRRLALEYGDSVHYVYRDFPVTELHPDAFLASEAGACAHAQGKFWAFHDRVYVQQADLRTERLVQFAGEAGLNVDAFTRCLSSHAYADEVEQDYQDGLKAGVQGTPTFFINGNRVPGSIPEEVLRSLFERILTKESI